MNRSLVCKASAHNTFPNMSTSKLRGKSVLSSSYQDRQTTRRIFTDRKQTIQKKSHEISTIAGRPGVEVEVLIKDGNDWYLFHSAGWIPGDRPGVRKPVQKCGLISDTLMQQVNAHIIESKGPGDFMTHNEAQALQASIGGSPSKEKEDSSEKCVSRSRSTSGSYDMLDLLASQAVEEMEKVANTERQSSLQPDPIGTPSHARSSSHFTPLEISRTGTPVMSKDSDPPSISPDLPSTFLRRTSYAPRTPDSLAEGIQIQTPPPSGSSSLNEAGRINGPPTKIRTPPLQREASKPASYFDPTTVSSQQRLFETQISDPSYCNSLHWSGNGKNFIMGGGISDIKKETDVSLKSENDNPSENTVSPLENIPHFIPAPPALGPLRSASRQRRRTSTRDLDEIVVSKKRKV